MSGLQLSNFVTTAQEKDLEKREPRSKFKWVQFNPKLISMQIASGNTSDPKMLLVSGFRLLDRSKTLRIVLEETREKRSSLAPRRVILCIGGNEMWWKWP